MSSITPPPAFIRPFRAGDENDIASVCCCTGNSGKDATGFLSDDLTWGNIWVLPYAHRHPELTWVVEISSNVAVQDGASISETSGQVVGYVVATPDTKEFYDWFREEWWPPRRPDSSSGHSGSDSAMEAAIMCEADAIGLSTRGEFEYTEQYPAHLHINLLPIAQGRGFGSQLIGYVLRALRDRGLQGVHLGSSSKNDGATSFYRRLGFEEKPSPVGLRIFTCDLTASNPWWANV